MPPSSNNNNNGPRTQIQQYYLRLFSRFLATVVLLAHYPASFLLAFRHFLPVIFSLLLAFVFLMAILLPLLLGMMRLRMVWVLWFLDVLKEGVRSLRVEMEMRERVADGMADFGGVDVDIDGDGDSDDGFRGSSS